MRAAIASLLQRTRSLAHQRPASFSKDSHGAALQSLNEVAAYTASVLVSVCCSVQPASAALLPAASSSHLLQHACEALTARMAGCKTDNRVLDVMSRKIWPMLSFMGARHTAIVQR